MGSGGSKCAAAPADGVAGGGGDDGEESGSWRGERVRGLACLCLPSSFSSASDDEPEIRKRVRRRHGVRTGDTVAKSSKPGPNGCAAEFPAPCPGQPTCSTTSGGAGPVEDSHGITRTSHATDESGDGDGASTDQAAAFTGPRFGTLPDRIVSRLGRAAGAGSSAGGAHSGSAAQSPGRDDRVGGWDGDGSPANGNGGIREGRHVAADTVPPLHHSVGSNPPDTEACVTGEYSRSRSNNVRNVTLERRPSRRHGAQDPLEGSIRFSRTLSVGRLRDRVLRRPSFSDSSFDPLFLENRLAEYHGDASASRLLHRAMRGGASSDRNTDAFTAFTGRSVSGPITYYNHDFASEVPPSREASMRDTLENRATFLERRGRLRSQVRALQRLGSRVENIGQLVEHESSCVLSGRHRTGRCTCRAVSRSANSVGHTGTRSSISRIVMLAEALFEVLDEIHQQAVVLASRPPTSSVGSIPAPKEVVERMPLRIHGESKVHHNDESTQCYICLVEYEEGDHVRTLPCHHEFHRKCVDKWLKEIHRVCPLCRGDVCISDASHLEKPN